ncbi:MAG: CPBP family intramembrane metalloprotease [Spirochaetes bacterium]|nr:CPBP family intramembrane metalloprotease [Spirochaetota bacterium]
MKNKKIKKHKLSAWWLFILVPFGSVVTSVIFAILYSLNMGNIDNFLNAANISNVKPLALFIYGTAAFVAAIILTLFLKKKGLSLKELGYKNKISIKMIIYSVIAFIIGLILYSFISSLMSLLNIPMMWNSNLAVSISTSSDIIFTFIGATFLGIIGEDTIFRGYLLSMFRERIDLKWSVILSVLIFAVIHLYFGPGVTVWIIPWAFMSCYLFIKFDSIYPCMLFHFLNNLVAYIILPIIYKQ